MLWSPAEVKRFLLELCDFLTPAAYDSQYLTVVLPYVDPLRPG